MRYVVPVMGISATEGKMIVVGLINSCVFLSSCLGKGEALRGQLRWRIRYRNLFFIMRPHSDNFYCVLRLYDFIHEAMLYVYATRISSF